MARDTHEIESHYFDLAFRHEDLEASRLKTHQGLKGLERIQVGFSL